MKLQSASGGCQFVATRCAALAPALQHALQQLAGRRLRDIVAEL
jgi:hypothetical protein